MRHNFKYLYNIQIILQFKYEFYYITNVNYMTAKLDAAKSLTIWFLEWLYDCNSMNSLFFFFGSGLIILFF